MTSVDIGVQMGSHLHRIIILLQDVDLSAEFVEHTL